MVKPLPKSTDYKRALSFLFDYFLHSVDKRRAWLLLTGSILCILALTGLAFILGWWCFPYIYAAFMVKNLSLLLLGTGIGLSIAGGLAAVNYLYNYFKNKLYVSWRAWLTKKIIHQYLDNKTNYLAISRIYKDIDNPEQRIQEDIDKVVDSALDLSLGFVDNLTNLIIFTVLLGLIGAPLSLVFFGMSLTIPGYLIFIALVVGGVTSAIGYLINRKLQKVSNEETKTQSSLRADLQQLKSNAEEIAIEKGEKYYQTRLNNEVDDLKVKTKKRLGIQNRTNSFNVFNNFVQSVIPVLALVPLFFKDLITLNVFYTAGYYFAMVTRSLTWFINAFEKINTFKTSFTRVLELQKILDNPGNPDINQIKRQVDANQQNIIINNLDLRLPNDSNELVIKHLNIIFERGKDTLIQAPSGTGKSSLYKAIAGTWLAGKGKIIIPAEIKSIYFLPQKPTIPDDTLRYVLAYPEAGCSFSDTELKAALKAVDLEKLTDKLDEKIGFKSLGEQQRIAFARIFLRKPDLVFLDESTASLDESGEEQIYRRLKALLPKTTFISIAHRSTVRQFHNKVMFFSIRPDKQVDVIEDNLVTSAAARL